MMKVPVKSAHASSRPYCPYLLAPVKWKVRVGVSEVLLEGSEQIDESDEENDGIMGRC
jgi:hypothetical protein